MKTNRMIWNIGRYMCLALLVAFAACTRDEFADYKSVQYEKGLCFSLYADGDMQLAGTRSAGLDDLNEDLIKTVDIFLFKNDGSLNEGGYAHAGVTASDEVVYLYRGRDWLDNNFNQQDGPYTVYALANYKGDAKLTDVLSLDDLKAVVAEDNDVVKWKGMAGYQDKTFLMDGKIEVTYDELSAVANQSYVATVPLSRAAVKIELTLNFSEDWEEKFMATGLKAQLSNYASITPALADGNPLDGDQRGLSNYPGLSGAAVDNFSEAPVFDRGTNFNGSQIRFYTYVNRWDDFIDNETMLLIDLPGRYDVNGNPSSSGAEVLAHNFYKVPIINNAEPQVFKRNTFYQITAVVDMKGTATIDEPEELTKVHFETAEWKENEVDGGDADADYLMLNQYYVDIRNVDSYDGLEFYSSSPIVSVEIVGFEKQADAQTAGIDFPYPGEPQPGAAIEIPGVYFVNKYNQRQEVDESDPNKDNLPEEPSTYDDEIRVDWDKNATNGKIYLTSTNPENVSKRYITLKVTNTDRLSKYVVVEQYPLEYIQPIPGYYSYRDDIGYYDNTLPPPDNYIACGYETEFVNTLSTATEGRYSSIELDRPYQSTEFVFFNSKVFYNDAVYRYDFTSIPHGTDEFGNNLYKWSALPAERENLNNNMMYFVTITQTSDRYKIAYPLKEETIIMAGVAPIQVEYAVSSAENDQLASPTFMLASSLGGVTSAISGDDFWDSARKHCALYVETYKNGTETVKLDDWRLPTSEEIKVILQYQYNDKAQDVMDKILTEDYYYVCWGDAEGDGIVYNEHGNNNAKKGVRCVRDVKVTDKFLQNNN